MSEDKNENLSKAYRKTMVNALVHSFSIGFSVALLNATYILVDIKGGEYPEMPKAEIEQQYNAILPSVIIEAILICVGLTILVSILNLYFRFKYEHQVNMFSLLKAYRQEKRPK